MFVKLNFIMSEAAAETALEAAAETALKAEAEAAAAAAAAEAAAKAKAEAEAEAAAAAKAKAEAEAEAAAKAKAEAEADAEAAAVAALEAAANAAAKAKAAALLEAAQGADAAVKAEADAKAVAALEAAAAEAEALKAAEAALKTTAAETALKAAAALEAEAAEAKAEAAAAAAQRAAAADALKAAEAALKTTAEAKTEAAAKAEAEATEQSRTEQSNRAAAEKEKEAAQRAAAETAQRAAAETELKAAAALEAEAKAKAQIMSMNSTNNTETNIVTISSNVTDIFIIYNILNTNENLKNTVNIFDIIYELLDTKSVTGEIKYNMYTRKFISSKNGLTYNNIDIEKLKDNSNFKKDLELGSNRNDNFYKKRLLDLINKPHQQGGGRSYEPMLHYELHLAMYIQKCFKLLAYRYFLKKQGRITKSDFVFEFCINMVLFHLLNMSDASILCYIIDQVFILISVITYLQICYKEKYDVNLNIISGIILTPVYLLFYE